MCRFRATDLVDFKKAGMLCNVVLVVFLIVIIVQWISLFKEILIQKKAWSVFFLTFFFTLSKYFINTISFISIKLLVWVAIRFHFKAGNTGRRRLHKKLSSSRNSVIDRKLSLLYSSSLITRLFILFWLGLTDSMRNDYGNSIVKQFKQSPNRKFYFI